MKVPKIKKNKKCSFCGRRMGILYKIADPNLNLNEHIDWLDIKSWWYVCRSCRRYIKDTQKEEFEKFCKRKLEDK